jgi:hypothetical protein
LTSLFLSCPLAYINDLPQIINSHSKCILFADDTSIVIYRPDSNYFQNSIDDVFADLNNWFKANKLTLNFDKTKLMKFTTTNKISINFNIGYDNKTIEEVFTPKFLGLQIDNLNWKKHIEYIIPKFKFSMLCHEDSHTIVESRCIKICLLCLFPFSYIIWSYLLGKFNRQQKEYLSSKRKSFE